MVEFELSVRVKTPRDTVGGTTETNSVSVLRVAVPLPTSPWNAPVALTIENEDSVVTEGLVVGAGLANWMVTDPFAVVNVKVATVDSSPDRRGIVTKEPVTTTWPNPVIVPMPRKVVVVPEARLPGELIVVTKVPLTVPLSASVCVVTGDEMPWI
jgi:hypothetical protein